MKKSELLVSGFLVLMAVLSYFFDSYVGVYAFFSAYLVFYAFSVRKINARFFAVFFLFYYVIPFLNISTYRGDISIDTLAIYSLMQFLVLSFVSFYERGRQIPDVYVGFKSTQYTELMFWSHLAIIYLMVAYVYASIGFIVVRQDLRFNIHPGVEYIIKSGLVLPLIWLFSYDFKPRPAEVFKKFLLPVLPSLLIGSRGTFIMILISMMISLYVYKVYGPIDFIKKFSFAMRRVKTYGFIAVALAVIALYTGFYIRRDGTELITATELLTQYDFTSSSLWVMAILPLYIGLRESVGITNRIIQEGISSPAEFPMFFMEMLTFLPGHQEAPGIILARDIYMASGTDEKYSLTPGIVGGLYMDYGMFCVPIIVFMALVVVYFYNKGVSDLRYRMIYAISVVQFFHLYHRGFLKLEYLVPYFIIIGFYFTLRAVRISRGSGE